MTTTRDPLADARARLTEATRKAAQPVPRSLSLLLANEARMTAYAAHDRQRDLRTEVREAFATVRQETRDRDAADFHRLADRIDQLTLALIHAGILPPSETHALVIDLSDQYGTIPGCRCGTCPTEHREGCACPSCRAEAARAPHREDCGCRACHREDCPCRVDSFDDCTCEQRP